MLGRERDDRGTRSRRALKVKLRGLNFILRAMRSQGRLDRGYEMMRQALCTQLRGWRVGETLDTKS